MYSMPKSLLEQLPEIVKRGREEATKILESIENRHRVTLHTREVVLPAKDSAAQDWVTAQNRQEQQTSPNDAFTLASKILSSAKVMFSRLRPPLGLDLSAWSPPPS